MTERKRQSMQKSIATRYDVTLEQADDILQLAGDFIEGAELLASACKFMAEDAPEAKDLIIDIFANEKYCITQKLINDCKSICTELADISECLQSI